MAFKSKDGKRNFGNRQQAQAYDERSSAPKQKQDEAAAGEPDEAGAESSGVHEQEASANPIEEHVAEHGPAEKVEIHHDHEAAKHTKVSHHGGAKHVSHHGSVEEAHQAGMTAAGAGQQEPDGDEAQPAMAGASDGGAIPGM